MSSTMSQSRFVPDYGSPGSKLLEVLLIKEITISHWNSKFYCCSLNLFLRPLEKKSMYILTGECHVIRNCLDCLTLLAIANCLARIRIPPMLGNTKWMWFNRNWVMLVLFWKLLPCLKHSIYPLAPKRTSQFLYVNKAVLGPESPFMDFDSWDQEQSAIIFLYPPYSCYFMKEIKSSFAIYNQEVQAKCIYLFINLNSFLYIYIFLSIILLHLYVHLYCIYAKMIRILCRIIFYCSFFYMLAYLHTYLSQTLSLVSLWGWCAGVVTLQMDVLELCPVCLLSVF